MEITNDMLAYALKTRQMRRQYNDVVEFIEERHKWDKDQLDETLRERQRLARGRLSPNEAPGRRGVVQKTLTRIRRRRPPVEHFPAIGRWEVERRRYQSECCGLDSRRRQWYHRSN